MELDQPIFNLPKSKELRKKLRREMTPAEEMLWVFLKNNNFGTRFRRQLSIDSYIVDFCCWGKKLIIEVDGKIHDRPDIIKYDKRRERHLKKAGFKIIRFKNQEVLDDPDGVVEKIRLALPK